MSCCNNPIELNCITKCDQLVLPVTVTSMHYIKAEFNGVSLNLDFAINNSEYAVVDKSKLNEDYYYTIGVFNSSNVNVGCYKIKIMPSTECCDKPSTDVSTKRIIADYATLNSDSFLTSWIGQDKAYGYKCTAAKYNGVSLDLGDVMMFTSTELLHVPVQVAPRNTIPEHDTNTGGAFLTYDKNWIDFLQSLPIADYLTFSTSPFSGSTTMANTPDRNFPDTEVTVYPDNISEINVYGEGFQIERNYPSTFSFTIEYIYAGPMSIQTVEDPYGPEITGHTIIFRDDAYFIDGGKVYPANVKVIQST